MRRFAVLAFVVALSCSSNGGPAQDGQPPGDEMRVDGAALDGPSDDTIGADSASDGAIPASSLSCYQKQPFPTTPPIDRSCKGSADCIAVTHMVDCCGTMVAIGINLADKGRFDTAEKACAATFPACGCAAEPTKTDDGSWVAGPSTAEATCDNGRCRTFIKGCGAPCPAGLACFACTSGPVSEFECSTQCGLSTDCTDPSRPSCRDSAYGPKFCTAKAVCNAP